MSILGSGLLTGVSSPPLDDSGSVVLFLKGNGTNGSTNIIDSSPTPKTISVFGTAQISTAQSKYGGSSLYFDGSGDYISGSLGSNSFNIRTNTYTIECWHYGISGNSLMFGSLSSDFYIQRVNNIIYVGDGIVNNITYFIGDNLWNNTWNHVALSFDLTTYRLFLNGILIGSTGFLIKAYNLSTFSIGYRPDNPQIYTNAYIDSLRISNFVRYTANFNSETDTYLNV